LDILRGHLFQSFKIMELLRGLSGLRQPQRPCVATIGAFDGVHLGHRAVIDQLADHAREHAAERVVVTFEPLPREYLAPTRATARLQSFREKFESLAALGVDRLLCLRFDEALRRMSAEAFARTVFVDTLNTRVLVLGDDFRFGCDREGDANFMRAFGASAGFKVLPTDTVSVDGERVSSTRLRAALQDGDFALAARLLGRPFSMSGRVTYGRQLARTLDAPTANIALRHRYVPLRGVYAVTVDGEGLKAEPGVANVGSRPTVDSGERPNLEVHLLHGSFRLYGKHLRVNFHHKLRDERRFDSLDLLKAQIGKDAEAARDWLVERAKETQNA
jgi:riboflavin kinase/FMN adenylyltransferase